MIDLYATIVLAHSAREGRYRRGTQVRLHPLLAFPRLGSRGIGTTSAALLRDGQDDRCQRRRQPFHGADRQALAWLPADQGARLLLPRCQRRGGTGISNLAVGGGSPTIGVPLGRNLHTDQGLAGGRQDLLGDRGIPTTATRCRDPSRGTTARVAQRVPQVGQHVYRVRRLIGEGVLLQGVVGEKAFHEGLQRRKPCLTGPIAHAHGELGAVREQHLQDAQVEGDVVALPRWDREGVVLLEEPVRVVRQPGPG